MSSFIRLIMEQEDAVADKPKRRRRDKRSLPATDREERRRHDKKKTPIFLRRCIVNLMSGDKKFDSDAAYAICFSRFKKAGYYRKGKDGKLVLTAKGKKRDQEYFDQEDTPAKLDRFDALMKQGRIDRAMKKAFESNGYEKLAWQISLFESGSKVVFVDEEGLGLGFDSIPTDIMIRSLSQLGVNVEQEANGQIVITDEMFRQLGRAMDRL